MSRKRTRAVAAGSSLPLLAVFLSGLPPPTVAQVAATATITTDYRYRGVPVSDVRPAISLELAYDNPGGGYAGGSVIASNAPGAGPRVLGVLADVGYAHRLRGDLTLDVGVSHASFFRYDYRAESNGNTEGYAGLSRGQLRAYVYYSPRYFLNGVQTFYFSLDDSLRLVRRLRLFGHVGVLDTVSAPTGGDTDIRYDARLGVAGHFRGGEVQLAWTTRGGGSPGPPGTSARNSAVVLGASLFF